MASQERRNLYRAWLTETGTENLTDQQLMEAFLGICRVSEAASLSRKLMAHYNTIWNVLTSPLRELMSIQGIDEKTAVLINAVGNIYTRGQVQYELKSAVTTPEQAAKLLIPRFRGLDIEAVYAIYLDNILLPRSIDLVCTGTNTSAHLEIFPMICQAGHADSRVVIIAHNHPTYDPTPSSSDVTITSCLASKLETLGMLLLDHIIVAKDTFVSMAADGYVKTIGQDGVHYIIPADKGGNGCPITADTGRGCATNM